MPEHKGWEVDESDPVDGFSTSTLKQVVIHHWGPAEEVGIRIDGEDKGRLGQTDATYFLPTNGGNTVLVEVLLLPDTTNSHTKGEFRY